MNTYLVKFQDISVTGQVENVECKAFLYLTKEDAMNKAYELANAYYETYGSPKEQPSADPLKKRARYTWGCEHDDRFITGTIEVVKLLLNLENPLIGEITFKGWNS